MKSKKWIYGLGGLAIVAASTLAIVGCACTERSKTVQATPILTRDVIDASKENSVFKYDTNTRTANFVISGTSYDEIKKEIDALQPQTVKDMLEEFFFGAKLNLIHPDLILKSEIGYQAMLRPTEVADVKNLTFTHDKTSKQIVLSITFAQTPVMNEESIIKEVLDVVKSLEVTDYSTPVEVRDHIEKVWQMIGSALINNHK